MGEHGARLRIVVDVAVDERQLARLNDQRRRAGRQTVSAPDALERVLIDAVQHTEVFSDCSATVTRWNE